MAYGRAWRPRDGIYQDILDGKISKHYFSLGIIPILRFLIGRAYQLFLYYIWRDLKGFGTQEGDIRLIINTDGVKVYRRAKKHAWPVWAINANLPPSQRYKLHNLMLVGIFFGEQKPNMASFLKPIIADLNQYSRQAFQVVFADRPNQVVDCRVSVIAFPVDMDARVH